MNIQFPHSENRAHHTDPIQFTVNVDGHRIQAAIDWATIHQVMDNHSMNGESIGEFVRLHRSKIELAIKSHIMARGIPVAGYLNLSADELRATVQK